ncbi:MAG: carboxylesterase family protein [Bacteroidales bacterium]|nr:carboxylesterase family protein [Bacteroidales bacterium]
MKKILLAFFTLISLLSFGQETYQFAEKDGQKLYLDVYKSGNPNPQKPLFVYVFGGGFIQGQRFDKDFLPFIKILNDNGFNVVSIDYRLGLKNSGQPGYLNFKPLLNSIRMASEDLLSACRFLVDNEKVTGVSAKEIVTCGSSAGAITVLQADYEVCNKFEPSRIVSDDFRFAGVIAFSGAIFSKNGKVKYRKSNPAPTMLIHGTADKVVPYGQMKMLKWCFSGSSKISDRLKKYNYPYMIRRYENLHHEVNFYVEKDMPQILSFIQDYVIDKKTQPVDTLIKGQAADINESKNATSRKDLYKKN